MIPRKFEILFSERKMMKDDLIHIDLELIVFDILQVSKKWTTHYAFKKSVNRYCNSL